MSCAVCKCPATLHGSQLGAPAGSYLAESGCHNGVWMDDDEFAEGWQPDVVTRPCPRNPAACEACEGTGYASMDADCLSPCEPCEGTGWKNGDWQEPDDRYHADEAVVTRGATAPEGAPDGQLGPGMHTPTNPVSDQGR